MNENSIRTTLPRLTKLMIVVLILLLLPANMCFQLYLDHHQQAESSKQMFEQVKQIMEMNAKDLAEEVENHSRVCIQKAEMAAYFISHAPSVISDLNKVRELASKLEVDEIHFFTPDGRLYAGTHPQFYGYTFTSGPQMEFFLPMLEDTSLKLCQEIAPNTTERKEMQYAAVWLKDQSGIVQIGMRPERLLAKIQARSLQQLIANIPFDYQGHLHICNLDTKKVVASSASELVGQNIADFDWQVQRSHLPTQDIHVSYNGESFCVYMEHYNHYLLVRTYLSQHTMRSIVISTVLLLTYILLAAIAVIGVIVWYINKHISKNLLHLNQELKKIEEGNLSSIALNTGILEFDELIFDINQLLKSIELGWGRLSRLIDSSRIPLGIFEYNEFYKKAFVNAWMLHLLGIQEQGDPMDPAFRQKIWERLSEAERCCVDPKEDIYKYRKNGEEIFLRLCNHRDEQSITYYITDVSSWWNKIHILRDESSRDQLTGLYNRRGMADRLNDLFQTPEVLGHTALVMLDADGLKHINDVYGHQMGDEYLKAIGNVLLALPEDHSVRVRLGGDEFLLFLYGYASDAQIDEALDGIRAKRGMNFQTILPDLPEKLEFSIGCARCPADGQDYHLLMRLADERMYQEKKARKAFRV